MPPAWEHLTDGLACPIDRVSADGMPVSVFLREYVHRSRPLIITDALSGWPAMQLWRRDTLVARFADLLVSVGPIPYGTAFGRPQAAVPLGEFLRGMRSRGAEKEPPYVFDNSVLVGGAFDPPDCMEAGWGWQADTPVQGAALRAALGPARGD